MRFIKHALKIGCIFRVVAQCVAELPMASTEFWRSYFRLFTISDLLLAAWTEKCKYISEGGLPEFLFRFNLPPFC